MTETATPSPDLPEVDDILDADDESSEERRPRRVKTLDAWRGRKTHDVVLPSGAEIVIEIPSFPEMLESGVIPNALIPQVLEAANQKGENDITAESIKKNQTFVRWLVSKTVVDPVVTEEEARTLPPEDVDLIYQLATRARDIDAAGRHLGGLESLESFRELRNLGPSLASALGL